LVVKFGVLGTQSFHAIAIKVLKKEGPLTTDELTKKISKYRKFRGETPNRTISAIHVKYVGNGRYDIIPKTL